MLTNIYFQYFIILIVLLIISLVFIKLKQKNFSNEINKLLKYLGGKDNIVNVECNMSRLKVILKDITIVDKEGIQKLGAKGIVEIDNQLKIIFDKNAKALKKYIKDLL